MCKVVGHADRSRPYHVIVYDSGAVGVFGVYSNWDPTMFPLNRFRISSYRTPHQ